MSIAVDSGACDNVCPPEDLPQYADFITDTQASLNGEEYVSASGDPIPNYGQLKVPMMTRELSIRGMTFQAAGVAKPLCSVDKLCEAGHIVVFDSEGSYIYNKHTGAANAMRAE